MYCETGQLIKNMAKLVKLAVLTIDRTTTQQVIKVKQGGNAGSPKVTWRDVEELGAKAHRVKQKKLN